MINVLAFRHLSCSVAFPVTIYFTCRIGMGMLVIQTNDVTQFVQA